MNITTIHGDLPERFTPETVDDEIASYLNTEPQPLETTGDARLIHEIAAYHALPPQAGVSLARVRARLRTVAQATGSNNSGKRGAAVTGTTNGATQVQTMPPSRFRHLTPLSTPLRAVAAVLVVALLVGAFVVVFHLPGVRQNATLTILPTSTPNLRLCTSTPGDVANIQSGGYGADLDTFEQRWGSSDGVAAGSVYFGRWPDGTSKVQVADALPSNHRVYMMGYQVEAAQNVTQAEGEALAASILPKDATPIAHAQQNNNITVTYCSAALITAFPASVQNINGPLPHNGLVVVTYTLRPDGHLYGIGFGPMP